MVERVERPRHRVKASRAEMVLPLIVAVAAAAERRRSAQLIPEAVNPPVEQVEQPTYPARVLLMQRAELLILQERLQQAEQTRETAVGLEQEAEQETAGAA